MELSVQTVGFACVEVAGEPRVAARPLGRLEVVPLARVAAGPGWSARHPTAYASSRSCPSEGSPSSNKGVDPKPATPGATACRLGRNSGKKRARGRHSRVCGLWDNYIFRR